MKNKWIIAGVSALLFAAGAAARSYNPMKWIKKGPSPTATEQLAAHSEEDKKLTLQLQALLPPRTTLKNACSSFKDLEGCVAALHVSHNLQIKFNCLKWDLTAVKPGESDPRAEAGCRRQERSEERREARARGHQGRKLVKDGETWRNNCK